MAEFKLYLMLPKTVSQTEGMILGGKTVCAGGGFLFSVFVVESIHLIGEKQYSVKIQ